MEKSPHWRDSRRQAILDVAFRTFLERGYAETSMAEIAARLGGSKTTLYHYFPSKEHLFVAVVEFESARTLEQLNEFVAPIGDVQAVLAAFGRHFLAAIGSADNIAFHRMIIAETVRFPQIGQIFYQSSIERGLSYTTVFVARMMEAGLLRSADARHAAIIFTDLCTGHLQRRWLMGFEAAMHESEMSAQAASAADAFLAIYAALSSK